MNEMEKSKLFRIRCKSKSGGGLVEEESKFCEEMFKKFPKEYKAMNDEIFEATRPGL